MFYTQIVVGYTFLQDDVIPAISLQMDNNGLYVQIDLYSNEN